MFLNRKALGKAQVHEPNATRDWTAVKSNRSRSAASDEAPEGAKGTSRPDRERNLRRGNGIRAGAEEGVGASTEGRGGGGGGEKVLKEISRLSSSDAKGSTNFQMSHEFQLGAKRRREVRGGRSWASKMGQSGRRG